MNHEFTLSVARADRHAIADARTLLSDGQTPREVQGIARALVDLDERNQSLESEVRRLTDFLKTKGVSL